MEDVPDDDEIVDYETAIADGLPESSGLRKIPVTRGDVKRRVLRRIERHIWEYLALGGLPAEARAECEAVIATWEANASKTT